MVCHPAISATPAQQQALAAANAIRNSAGLPAFTMPETLNTAAQNHANYFVHNSAAYATGLSPHYEDANFPNGFTGVKPKDRGTSAGFSGSVFEDMSFLNNPQAAVAQLVNTVFHRVYFVHPSFTQLGYGGASDGSSRNADVFDFALGTAADPSKIVVFPTPNATNVPPSFNVTREGPNPPPPPGGGAITGPIVSVLFDRSVSASAVINKHEIRDSLGNLLPHTLVGPNTPTFGAYMVGSYAFYADGPAAPGAVFSVHLEGTLNGAPFTKDWSFTTGAATL